MPTLRGRRVVFPDGERPASIQIAEGRIVSIASIDDVTSGDVIDAGNLVVSPGIVDSHVHVNDPGRADWEGFDTATRAAAAGGVTTIVDMPLNSIPATTTSDALSAKREAARGRCHVDVAFWGGVVPDNERDIEPLIDAGVRGFKCFLVPSGVDEFKHVGADTLRRVMPILARRRLPLLVHAELPELLLMHRGHDRQDAQDGRDRRGNPASYREYEATRPPVAEAAAIQMMSALAHDTYAHVHIVHVSSADGVTAVAAAKASGIRMTAETCPQYLAITDEEVPDGATEFKCAPPIRTSRDRDALWRGLEAATLDLIASDHSPAPPSMKCAPDFIRAWGGIAGLELSLPMVWTHASRRKRTPVDLARWMSAAPAALAGFAGQKGVIAAGADADFVVWDPDAEFTVDASKLQQRHKLTPYAGTRLRGVVHETFVRGERIWTQGRLAQAGSGQLL